MKKIMVMAVCALASFSAISCVGPNANAELDDPYDVFAEGTGETPELHDQMI